MGEGLAIKYRPSGVDDLIGNEETVAVIRAMVSGERPWPPSVMFYGPTGCGKTTLARITARALGAKGPDIQELDIADLRGIDTVRTIRQEALHLPIVSPVRVYILDEAHQLTKDAQNALLKILEEPPPHVHFILCTTDPQNLIPTIRSRVLSLQVSTLSEKEAFRLMMRVVREEGIEVDAEMKEAMVLLSHRTDGFPRTTLQALQSVITAPPGMRRKVAEGWLKLEARADELVKALIQGAPWSKVANILSTMRDEDPEQVIRGLMSYLEKMILSQDNPKVGRLLAMLAFTDVVRRGFSTLVGLIYHVHSES